MYRDGDKGASFADFFFGTGAHVWWRGFFLVTQLVNVVFSLVSAGVNAYTSIHNYMRALNKLRAQKEWNDYSGIKKFCRGGRLLFTYGTLGEICGGIAGVLSGFVYTVLSVVGVIIGVSFPISTLCVSIASLAFSALYYTSYMSVNIERDYKKTQVAAYRGMIVQGALMLSSGLIMGVLIIAAKVFGVAFLSFIAAATPGGIAVVVGCLLLGAIVLGASLYMRHRKQKAEAKLKLEEVVKLQDAAGTELKFEEEARLQGEPGIRVQKEPTKLTVGLRGVIKQWWRGDSVQSMPLRASIVHADDTVLPKVEMSKGPGKFNILQYIFSRKVGNISQQSNQLQLPPKVEVGVGSPKIERKGTGPSTPAPIPSSRF